MKKILAGLLVMLAIGLLAGLNHAATQQLMVDHILTGFSKHKTSVTVNYTLHVVNPGGTSFSNLSLALVPLPPLVPSGSVVKVGDLAPYGSADVTLRIVAASLLDPEQFSRNGLFWNADYIDGDGHKVEFPIKSRPVRN